MRIRSLLVVWGLLAALPASGQDKARRFRFATNDLTHKYVRTTVHYHLDHNKHSLSRWTFPKLKDGEILRRLRKGKLDAGSVFLPVGPAANGGETTTGRARQESRLPKGAVVHSVGQLAAWVVAPIGRDLKQLTVKQLADILTGKITKWNQLYAGNGDIKIVYDDASLAVACKVCGIAPPGRRALSRWKVDSSYGLATLYNMAGDALTAERAGRGGKPPERTVPDDRLLIASSCKMLEQRETTTKWIRRVPIAPSHGKAAVDPSIKAIRGGSYPLVLKWRIVVRPDAPKKVKGMARICLRAYEGQLLNPHYVKDWLVPTTAADQPGVIRIFYYGGRKAFLTAASAYGKIHPKVRFADVSTVEKPVGAAFAERADLLVYVGCISADRRKKLRTLCGAQPEERLVGRLPLLLLAAQDCPVTSLTLKQARIVAASDLTKWKDLGWDCDRYVVKRARGFRPTAEALFDGNMKRRHNYPRSRPISKGQTEEEARAEGAAIRKHVKVGARTEAEIIKAVAADPYSLGFVTASDSALASGLKVLKLRVGSALACGPKGKYVVSGAYPAARPVSVLVHPKAGPAAKHFAAWLESPEAGNIFARHHIYSRAGTMKPSDDPKTSRPAQPEIKPFAGRISGAVAVLPTLVLNPHVIVIKESHRAAYEDAICAAAEADGHLKLVDRANLKKVWAERQCEMLAGQAGFKPVVSADVFAVPAVVLSGSSSALRIRFLHAQTASVLDEVHVPIDPENPVRFKPPLDRTLRAAWPRVLTRLSQVRARPTWAMLGVRVESEKELAEAARIEFDLRKTLLKDDRLFLCRTLDVDAAQQETLMAMLGAGCPAIGGFRPDADFLLEGRLRNGRVELRVLDGQTLAALAKESWAAKAGEKMSQWLSRQARELKLPASTKGTAPAADWGRAQAQLELKIAERLTRKIAALSEEARRRRVKAGRTKISDEDAEALRTLRRQRDRHLTRAAQLNPESEKIGLAFARALDQDTYNFRSVLRSAQLYARLGQLFRRSARHRETMEHAITRYGIVVHALSKTMSRGDWLGVPRGIDHAKLRRAYVRKILDLYEAYASRYAGCFDDPKERRGSWNTFPNYMNRYVYYASLYVYLSKADEKEKARLIERWSRIFDDRPKAGRHSDFLRLRFAAVENDRARFLKLLNAMQREHPDPKTPYWRTGGDQVHGDLYRLFRHGTDRCNFHKWRTGKRGIGGLPYDGYDPAKDTSEPAALNLD